MKNYIILWVFNILAVCGTCYAQSPSKFKINTPQNSEFSSNLTSDAYSILNTGLGFIKSPLTMNGDDALLSGLIIGVTLLGTSLDNPIRDLVKRNHSHELDQLANFTEKFGNPKYGIAISGLLYAGGHLIGDKKLRKTGIMLAQTIFFNGLIITGMKMTFGRTRPYKNEGNWDIDLFEFETDNDSHSLPSGHTSTAFAVATVLSKQIDNTYATVALYSLASLTAFQRIYADRHWISDTILGAAIGTLVGLKVVELHSEEENDDSINLKILPIYDGNMTGVGFSLQF